MVSPSKKRKLEGKSQANVSGTTLRATSLTGDCRLRRSQKPLTDKRFYLDLKNHVSSTKLETRLRSLGASVDAFLTKEVSYIVSDRPAWSNNATTSSQQHSQNQSGRTLPWSASSLFASASPATADSTAEGLASKRRLQQRSRAEAMLEKARQQQQTHFKTIDPLENARLWKIPIWPINKVLKWLDKIESNLTSTTSYLSVKTKSIKSPFIKFEDLSKQFRPVYGTLAVWPTLNIDCGEGGCPFSVPKSPIGRDKKPLRNAPQPVLEHPQCEQRMTRKSRLQPPRNDELLKAKHPVHHPGFCEICDTDYQDIQQHLNSSPHQKFVLDSRNFQDLDTLIKEGPSVEDFLKTIDPIGCATRRSLRGPASPQWSSPDIPVDSCVTGDTMRRPAFSNGQLRRTSQRQAEERGKAAVQRESPEVLSNGTSKVHSCKLPSNQSDRRSSDEDKMNEVTHNLRPRLPPADDTNCKRIRGRNSEGSSSVDGSCDSRDSCGDVETHSTTRSKTDPARTRQARNSSGSDSASCSVRAKRECDDVTNCDGMNGKQVLCLDEDSMCSMQSTKFRIKGKFAKKKRLSVEEKLLEDNKEYYKLEVINAKLRSSGYFCNQREASLPENGQTCGQHINDDTGDVELGSQKEESSGRSRRSRRSELSVLNDEADSYLFGDRAVKREMLSPTQLNLNRSPLHVHIYADDCANHVPSAPLAEQSMLPTIKEELVSPRIQDEGCHSGSDGSPNQHADGERKKRRTHAELFIHDNLDYYKFQLPESRLRLHGASNYPHSSDKTDDENTSFKCAAALANESPSDLSVNHIPHTKLETGEGYMSKSHPNIAALLSKPNPEAVEKMRFSFEAIPRSEPWFQTYRRQDDGDEFVEPLSDFEFERRQILPYELPSESFFARFGRGRGSPRGRGAYRNRHKTMPKSRAMQLVASARLPRKSPRCHASTLAILSSFVSKRRRQSLGLLSPEAVENQAISECLSDFQEIEKNLDEMLASPPSSPPFHEMVSKPAGRVRRRSQRRVTESGKEALDSAEQGITLDLAESIDSTVTCSSSPTHTCGLSVNADVDVVTLLNDFPQCHCVDDMKSEILQQCAQQEDEISQRLEMESECNSSTYDTLSESGTNYSNAKSRLKKRKRNLTGWPSAKPRKKKAEQTDDFLGVRIKMLPVHTRGKVHIMYRTTNTKAQRKSDNSSSREDTFSAAAGKRVTTQLDNNESLSPNKSGNCSPRGTTTTSSDVLDSSRLSRGSAFSSSSGKRRRESPRKQVESRARTRWGSPSLRRRW